MSPTSREMFKAGAVLLAWHRMSGEEKSGLDEVHVPSSLTGEQTQVPTASVT